MNPYHPVKPCHFEGVKRFLSKNDCDKTKRSLQCMDWDSLFSKHKQTLNLVDTGFAYGLRFLYVLKTWHERQLDPTAYLFFYGIEEVPPTLNDLKRVLSAYPDLNLFAQGLFEVWPSLTCGLHVLELKAFSCRLYLWFGATLTGIQALKSKVGAIFLSHGNNSSLEEDYPSTWIHALAKRSYSGTQLWSEHWNSSFQNEVGFAGYCLEIDSRGLRATYQRHDAKIDSFTTETLMRKVAVIGAGMAGSCIARNLCDRGIEVHLYDSAHGSAQGASGNWLGAFHPHITRDDTPLSQLTRFGFECTIQALNQLTEQGLLQKGVDWAASGHLQTVPMEESVRLKETLDFLQFPQDFAHLALADTVLKTHLDGVFFPQGGWIKPARWVHANLEACGSLLHTHFNTHLTSLESSFTNQFDAVVVACAQNSLDLSPVSGAIVGAVKGQITRVKKISHFDCVVSGESYAISSPQEDWVLLGATYERPVIDLTPTVQADEINRSRFEKAFPELRIGSNQDSRCAVRSVWSDRLPAIGASEQKKIYLATGYASRGLLWAALGAQIIQTNLGLGGLNFKLLERLNPTR